MKLAPSSLAFAAAVVATAASAQENAPAPEKQPEKATWSITVGYHVAHFHYEEPAIDIQENGVLHGPSVAVAGHLSRFMLGLEAGVAFGAVRYDGRTQSGIPLQRDSTDVMFDGRALVGVDVDRGSTRITPFTGLGYTYLRDDLHGANVYLREIGHVYLPLGLDVGTSSPRFRWSLRGEVDVLLGGNVTSHLEDVNPAFPRLTNGQQLGSGYALRASVRLLWPVARGVALGAEPYVTYWHVKDSEHVQALGLEFLEPENTTVLAGVRALAEF